MNYTKRIRKVDPKLSSRSTKERRSLFRWEVECSPCFRCLPSTFPCASRHLHWTDASARKERSYPTLLDELHNGKEAAASADEVNAKFDDVKTIYHMCQTSLYEKAVSSEKAYFPPTFSQDGKFTHATAIPANLITTANHFYTSTEGDWICIELDRDALENLGIVTVFESAMPVGDIDTDGDWKDSVFPHVFGGLPAHVKGVVTKKMKMSEDGTFLSIDGLVE